MARTASNIPLIMVGLAIIGLSLLAGKWPPDYVNARPGYLVSHQARLVGQDKPPELAQVERRPGYLFYRALDALVYLAFIQIFIASVAFFLVKERFFLLLLLVAALYGAVYSASLGLVIGSQLAFIGFSLIFIVSLLDLVTITRRTSDESHSAA